MYNYQAQEIESTKVDENLSDMISMLTGTLPFFPVKIMTKLTKGQVEVNSKEEILTSFRNSSYLDCRLNAYPTYTGYNGLNSTKRALIMIDLDFNSFRKYKNPSRQLDMALKKTINKMRNEINGEPMIILTGGGYHVYQPVHFEEMLTSKTFNTYACELNQNLTNLFMKFSQSYFSNGKADLNHNPTLKSCLLRIPGTINSKYGNIITLIQKWNRKPIQLDKINDIKDKGFNHILRIFEDWLIQLKINNRIEEIKISIKKKTFHRSNNGEIRWIERLLNTPLDDYRHYCLWRIIIPYLVNIKGISNYELLFNMLSRWLAECNNLRSLSFNPNSNIKSIMKSVRNYSPISLAKLKYENKILYDKLKSYGCF